MGPFEAVCFDMDGVLVTSAATWRDIEETEIIPESTTGSSPPRSVLHGLGIDDVFELLASTPEHTLTVSREEFRALYDDRATEVYRERSGLLDGFSEILTDLRAAECGVGLVSASPHAWITLALERFDLQDTFDIVIGADDIDAPTKPAPHCYQTAAESLGIPPERVITVEDSEHGVQAATRAGLYCIALRGTENAELDLSAAHTEVDSPAGLRSRLQELIRDGTPDQ